MERPRPSEVVPSPHPQHPTHKGHFNPPSPATSGPPGSANGNLRAEWEPWRLAVDPRSVRWGEGTAESSIDLLLTISHLDGGTATARFYATRSPSGEVVLRLRADGDVASLQLEADDQRRVQETSSRNGGTDADDIESKPGDGRKPAGRSDRPDASEQPPTPDISAAVSSSTSYSSSAPSVPVSSSSQSMTSVDEAGTTRSTTATTQTLQRESLLLLLPTEIQQHIYSFLPIAEIFATLPLVCRDIYQKTQRDDVFWHGIYDLHFGGPCEEDKLVRKPKPKKKQSERKGHADESPSDKGSKTTREEEEKGKEEKHKRANGDSQDGEATESTDLFWRKECARLMKELKDMEEDYEREIAVLDIELAKKKRKKARMHKRRRIKYAVEKGHLPLMKQFIRAAEVSVDVPLTEKKATPLMFAAIRGNVPIVNWLLANGANVNAVEEGCAWQPIIHASQGGHTEVVKILLSHGANVNAMTEKGGTPLMHATYEGYEEVVKILLAESGADVNVQSKNGESALMMAAEKGHANIVRLLLERGADTTLATHQSKRTAVWFAKENKQEEVVALFDQFATKSEPEEDANSN